MTTLTKLQEATGRTGSLISVGIEPSPDYLPEGFSPTPEGYMSFFRVFIEATRDRAAAFKFNLAFFESQGIEGVRLLHAVRELVPDDAVLIIDAKRGDIGSTAKHYAESIYEGLRADSTTVNPLMGRDSAEPFLAYEDRLTYFLGLTSNPGAQDFLIPGRLFLRIAEQVQSWSNGANAGLVVGATKDAADIAAIRAAAPGLPFLVPGVGAQGGDAKAIGAAGAAHSGTGLAGSGLLLHATRGVLPSAADAGRDVGEVIREKTEQLAVHIAEAVATAPLDANTEEVRR